MPKPTTPSTEPKPKRTHVLSPEMQALRDEHNARVKAFHDKNKSAATLETITEKLLPKLTSEDHAKLREALAPVAQVN